MEALVGFARGLRPNEAADTNAITELHQRLQALGDPEKLVSNIVANSSKFTTSLASTGELAPQVQKVVTSIFATTLRLLQFCSTSAASISPNRTPEGCERKNEESEGIEVGIPADASIYQSAQCMALILHLSCALLNHFTLACVSLLDVPAVSSLLPVYVAAAALDLRMVQQQQQLVASSSPSAIPPLILSRAVLSILLQAECASCALSRLVLVQDSDDVGPSVTPTGLICASPFVEPTLLSIAVAAGIDASMFSLPGVAISAILLSRASLIFQAEHSFLHTGDVGVDVDVVGDAHMSVLASTSARTQGSSLNEATKRRSAQSQCMTAFSSLRLYELSVCLSSLVSLALYDSTGPVAKVLADATSFAPALAPKPQDAELLKTLSLEAAFGRVDGVYAHADDVALDTSHRGFVQSCESGMWPRPATQILPLLQRSACRARDVIAHLSARGDELFTMEQMVSSTTRPSDTPHPTCTMESMLRVLVAVCSLRALHLLILLHSSSPMQRLTLQPHLFEGLAAPSLVLAGQLAAMDGRDILAAVQTTGAGIRKGKGDTSAKTPSSVASLHLRGTASRPVVESFSQSSSSSTSVTPLTTTPSDPLQSSMISSVSSSPPPPPPLDKVAWSALITYTNHGGVICLSPLAISVEIVTLFHTILQLAPSLARVVFAHPTQAYTTGRPEAASPIDSVGLNAAGNHPSRTGSAHANIASSSTSTSTSSISQQCDSVTSCTPLADAVTRLALIVVLVSAKNQRAQQHQLHGSNFASSAPLSTSALASSTSSSVSTAAGAQGISSTSSRSSSTPPSSVTLIDMATCALLLLSSLFSAPASTGLASLQLVLASKMTSLPLHQCLWLTICNSDRAGKDVGSLKLLVSSLACVSALWRWTTTIENDAEKAPHRTNSTGSYLSPSSLHGNNSGSSISPLHDSHSTSSSLPRHQTLFERYLLRPLSSREGVVALARLSRQVFDSWAENAVREEDRSQRVLSLANTFPPLTVASAMASRCRCEPLALLTMTQECHPMVLSSTHMPRRIGCQLLMAHASADASRILRLAMSCLALSFINPPMHKAQDASLHAENASSSFPSSLSSSSSSADLRVSDLTGVPRERPASIEKNTRTEEEEDETMHTASAIMLATALDASLVSSLASILASVRSAAGSSSLAASLRGGATSSSPSFAQSPPHHLSRALSETAVAYLATLFASKATLSHFSSSAFKLTALSYTTAHHQSVSQVLESLTSNLAVITHDASLLSMIAASVFPFPTHASTASPSGAILEICVHAASDEAGSLDSPSASAFDDGVFTLVHLLSNGTSLPFTINDPEQSFISSLHSARSLAPAQQRVVSALSSVMRQSAEVRVSQFRDLTRYAESLRLSLHAIKATSSRREAQLLLQLDTVETRNRKMHSRLAILDNDSETLMGRLEEAKTSFKAWAERTVEEAVAKCDAEILRMQADRDEAITIAESLQQRHTELGKELAECQAVSDKVTAALETTEAALAEAQLKMAAQLDRIVQLEQRNMQLESNEEALSAELETTKLKITGLEDDLSHEQDKVKGLSSRLDDMQAALDAEKAAKERVIQRHEAYEKETEKRFAEVNVLLTEKGTEVELLRLQKSTLDGQLETLETEKKELQERLKTAQEETATATKLHNDLLVSSNLQIQQITRRAREEVSGLEDQREQLLGEIAAAQELAGKAVAAAKEKAAADSAAAALAVQSTSSIRDQSERIAKDAVAKASIAELAVQETLARLRKAEDVEALLRSTLEDRIRDACTLMTQHQALAAKHAEQERTIANLTAREIELVNELRVEKLKLLEMEEKLQTREDALNQVQEEHRQHFEKARADANAQLESERKASSTALEASRAREQALHEHIADVEAKARQQAHSLNQLRDYAQHMAKALADVSAKAAAQEIALKKHSEVSALIHSLSGLSTMRKAQDASVAAPTGGNLAHSASSQPETKARVATNTDRETSFTSIAGPPQKDTRPLTTSSVPPPSSPPTLPDDLKWLMQSPSATSSSSTHSNVVPASTPATATALTSGIPTGSSGEDSTMSFPDALLYLNSTTSGLFADVASALLSSSSSSSESSAADRTNPITQTPSKGRATSASGSGEDKAKKTPHSRDAGRVRHSRPWSPVKTPLKTLHNNK